MMFVVVGLSAEQFSLQTTVAPARISPHRGIVIKIHFAKNVSNLRVGRGRLHPGLPTRRNPYEHPAGAWPCEITPLEEQKLTKPQQAEDRGDPSWADSAGKGRQPK